MPVGGVSLGRGNPVTYLQGVSAVENVDSGVVGCSIYCHNTDYNCGNLKALAERTISLMPQESWEVFDCSEDDEGDQSAGVETQASAPTVVQQIQTRSH